MSAKTIPSLPSVPAQTPSYLRPLLESLRDGAAVRHGLSKNQLDRSPTVRELQEAGLLTVGGSGRFALDGDRLRAVITGPGNKLRDSYSGPSQPNAVTFSVTAAGVLINWSPLSGVTQYFFSHAEIWRAGPLNLGEDESLPSVAVVDTDGVLSLQWVNSAQPGTPPALYLSGISNGSMYSEALPPASQFLYFVRFVDSDDRRGQWHALNGTRVDSSVDVDLYARLLEGQIDEAYLNSALAGRLANIELLQQALVDLELTLGQVQTDITDSENGWNQAVTDARTDLGASIDQARSDAAAANEALQGYLTDALVSVDETFAIVDERIEDAFASVQSARDEANDLWELQRILNLANRVKDTSHVIHTTARVATETTERVTETTALAERTDIVEASLYDNDTGLVGAAYALMQFKAYVEDQSGGGFLAQSSYIASLGSALDGADADSLSARATALEAFRTHVENQGAGGFLATSSYLLALESDFTSGLTGVQGRAGALESFQSHVEDQGGTGFLATSSYLGNIISSLESADSALSGRAEVLEQFKTHVEDTGPTGFLASSEYLLNITSAYENQVEELEGRADILEQFKTYVENQGAEGFLATSSYLTALETEISNELSGLSGRATTLEDFRTFVEDQGPEGFLATSEVLTAVVSEYEAADSALSGRAGALESFKTHVEDQSGTGFLATSSYLSSVLSTLDEADGALSARAQGLEEFKTHVEDQGGTGFLATSSYLGGVISSLGDDIAGISGRADALESFQSYVEDQGAEGFLANSAYILGLTSDYTNADAALAIRAEALETFQTHVEDQGEEGFLASSTYLGQLVTTFESADSALSGRAEILESFKTFVEDQTETGFLAGASYLSALQSSLSSDIGDVSSRIEEVSAIELTPLRERVDGLETETADINDRLMLESIKNLADRVKSQGNMIYSTAVVATEAETRSTETSALAQRSELIEAELYTPSTGLVGRATALEQFKTLVEDQGPAGFLAQSSFIQGVQNEIVAVDGSRAALAGSFQTFQSFVQDQGSGGFLATASYITNVVSTINNVNSDVIANANAFQQFKTHVEDQGPTGLFATSSYILNIESTINDVNNNVTADANAFQQFKTHVEDQGPTGFLAQSSYITSLENTVNGHTALWSQQASLNTTFDGRTVGRYYNKINANGRVTGFEFFDSGGTLQSTTSFIVQADTFQIRTSDGVKVPFSISGSSATLDVNVLNITGLIPEANIGGVRADRITVSGVGGASNIADVIIGSGHIDNAKIGNVIQSSTFNMGTGTGWRLDKAGGITAGSITIYNTSGQIILSSGTQVADIYNSAQTYANLAGAKPPVNADNTASNVAAGIAGQGAFATLNQITSANASTYIAALAVGTLQIGTNAVTIPRGSSLDANLTLFNSFQTVCSVTVDWGGNPPEGVFVMAFANIQAIGSSDASIAFRVNSSLSGTAGDIGITAFSGASTAVSTVWLYTGQSGSVIYSAQLLSTVGSVFKARGCGIVVLGTRR